MIEKESTERGIKSTCIQCHNKPCKSLHFKDALVFSDSFVIPFECPLRVEDESKLRWELQSLSDYEVSCIAGEIWVKHNPGARCGNGKQCEIEHIVNHFRQRKCIMIAKSASPWYKPWILFGFWTNISSFQLQSFKKKKEKDYTQELAYSVQQAPVKITSVSWIHTDTNLRKDSPALARTGDTIELQTQFENYIEGAGVDFHIYGIINGVNKQLTKVATRCSNNTASAEWVVDFSKCDSNSPGLEFECKVRDQVSPRKTIEIQKGPYGGFCIFIRDEHSVIITNAHVSIFADSIEVFSGIVPDGVLEIKDLPHSDIIAKIDINGQSFQQKVRLICCPPPYIPQIITADTDVDKQEVT